MKSLCRMSIFLTLAHLKQTGSLIYDAQCWQITWIHFTHLQRVSSIFFVLQVNPNIHSSFEDQCSL